MTYPALYLRVKALCLDSIIFIVLFYAAVAFIANVEIANTALRIAVVVLPLALIESVMIWLTGGSIGHHFAGIRVIDKSTGKNLFVLKGLVRFLVKLILGFYSLITMLITKRHQSVHDLASNSLVLFKDESQAHDRYKRAERTIAQDKVKPGVLRRTLIIVVYLVFTSVVFGLTSNFVASADCWENNICTGVEQISKLIFSLMVWVIFILVVVLGCKCKLPGARLQKIRET